MEKKRNEPRKVLSVLVTEEFMKRVRLRSAIKEEAIGTWVIKVLSEYLRQEGF